MIVVGTLVGSITERERERESRLIMIIPCVSSCLSAVLVFLFVGSLLLCLSIFLFGCTVQYEVMESTLGVRGTRGGFASSLATSRERRGGERPHVFHGVVCSIVDHTSSRKRSFVPTRTISGSVSSLCCRKWLEKVSPIPFS